MAGEADREAESDVSDLDRSKRVAQKRDGTAFANVTRPKEFAYDVEAWLINH